MPRAHLIINALAKLINGPSSSGMGDPYHPTWSAGGYGLSWLSCTILWNLHNNTLKGNMTLECTWVTHKSVRHSALRDIKHSVQLQNKFKKPTPSRILCYHTWLSTPPKHKHLSVLYEHQVQILFGPRQSWPTHHLALNMRHQCI
jgi:hypothetical protein